ncbi:hypothetical protein F2Q69_00002136 [Brassica cretica]|uniref:Uncharacterized protein n=1 Tax=Brassica cretica TaxID=69181 RepID=A0A8S9P7G4_BRACR|nr:hypothetical protein F2Q69_00002136 [Brassica cretica]
MHDINTVMTHHSHHLHFLSPTSPVTPSSPPSPPSYPPSPSSLKLEKERERERRRRRRKKAHMSSSPEQPCAVTTFSLPPPINTLDESVATKNASIGVRTKPHAPPEVSPLRAREVHAPPPENVATAGPPSPAAGISAVAAVDREMRGAESSYVL